MSQTSMTDFQRGAAAMRDSVEAMLRVHSEDMKRTAEAARKVVEIGAYEASARLLWSYANGVMSMKLPEDAPNPLQGREHVSP